MIVSYICCHEVSDHHTGMSFQRWKNKWKLSGNNRSTVSWNPKNNNLRPSVIQAENSFFLSLCCAWDDMTQTLSAGAIWAPAGDTEEAAPTTADKPGKTGVFSFTKGEGHFRCVNVKHSLGLCFMGPKYLNSRGTFASRSGGFARIWNTYGEFTYSEASESSPCVASQQSEAVGTILTPILQMAMLQLHRLINATNSWVQGLNSQPCS